MLAHFYIVGYILDMTPCEFFLLTKNGSWNLKQFVLITFLLLEYINLYIIYVKLYLLPKIHKRLKNVPGRPVISNCGTPTEKASEFLDHHHKPVMQSGWSYIKDSGDFLKKIKNVGNIPENAILVAADVVGLYPNIPHSAAIKALSNMLEAREHKAVSTEDLVKMARFVLENNYFEFNGDVKKQISGTAIGTKFAPPYACIFMDDLETKFLQSQSLQPLVWFRYIDDIFFIWTHGNDKLEKFLDDLNSFDNNIKFTHESSKDNVIFSDFDFDFEAFKRFNY